MSFSTLVPSCLFLLFFLTQVVQGQQLKWALSGGGAGYERFQAIEIDSNGDIYATGFFENSFDVDPGPNQQIIQSQGGTDIVTCKYSRAGNLIWYAIQGGPGDDSPRGLSLDPLGNVYVVGEFEDSTDFDPDPQSSLFLRSNGNKDAFVTKLNPNGQLIWAKSFGGIGLDRALSVSFNRAGIIHLTGHFSQTVDFDPSPLTTSTGVGDQGENIFISTFDNRGNFIWSHQFVSMNSSSRLERAYQLKVDQQNDLVVVGSFAGTIDFDPSPGNTVALASAGGEDGFILKLTASGVFLWAKQVSGIGSSTCFNTCLQLDEFDNIHIGGFYTGNVDFNPNASVNLNKTSNGSRDMFISRMGANGQLKWNVTAGGNSSEVVANMVIDRDGFVYATGYHYSGFDADPSSNTAMVPNNGNADAYFWELDTSGNYISAYAFGSSGLDISSAIAYDDRKDIFLAGAFSNTVDFDPQNGIQNISSNGDRDYFIQQVNICKKTLASLNGYGCSSYTSPSGKLITSSGLVSDTILNQNGCDSILSIQVNLNQLDTTVIQKHTSLESSAQGVNYQWMECINGNYIPLTGETAAVFTPSANGSYAVEVSQQSCRDTSACFPIINVSVSTNKIESLKLFPNPFIGVFTLELTDFQKVENIMLYDLKGKLVKAFYPSKNELQLSIDAPSGLYLLRVQLKDGNTFHKKIVKS